MAIPNNRYFSIQSRKYLIYNFISPLSKPMLLRLKTYAFEA